jgi:hypothetical protein
LYYNEYIVLQLIQNSKLSLFPFGYGERTEGRGVRGAAAYTAKAASTRRYFIVFINDYRLEMLGVFVCHKSFMCV